MFRRFCFVGMTRLERATPWSQTKYTTNCTTSRMLSSEKRYKISANRMKFQIYLKNSEVQPNLRLQSKLKLVQAE